MIGESSSCLYAFYLTLFGGLVSDTLYGGDDDILMAAAEGVQHDNGSSLFADGFLATDDSFSANDAFGSVEDMVL